MPRFISLFVLFLPALLLAQSTRVTQPVTIWGTGDGVTVTETGGALRIERNGRPMPAEQVMRGPTYLHIQDATGQLLFELSLKDPQTVRWVWNPNYGYYGSLIDLAGIQPASLQRVPDELTVNRARGGFWLQAIAVGSPAARADLQRGDQVIAIAGQRFASPVSLQRALDRAPLGQATLTILRLGQEMTVEVDASL